MRRITNFIVEKRYLFLGLFILLAGVCLFLATKVNINEDIMKYLPVTSETKIGKDIMDEEFAEEESSTLNVMFKGLSNREKKTTLKKLQKIKGVSSVEYANTKEYNKGKYTLYVLNVDDYDHSQTATNVYNNVQDNFKTAGMSGSIYEENKPILQTSIVILAIAFAMLILIILSESYVEPWLYLISIGIAVFINKGTNIMFTSVSSITNSIVAILQLALSMDYSIMLSNRYKQEKENNPNKIEAMKEALYQSFKAISSSSVTTIVGLIALVFMSFTIGKDLGFVLAKGVLLSLISIFLCLPALLLLFDNLIAKTKKKTPKMNLTKLGKFSYRTRFMQAGLIVILFGGAFLLKGNINILYTASEQDQVGKVFPATNQMAIVYNNKYEDIMAQYCQKLAKDKKIDQVLCYSNTLNEKLAYEKLNQKFKDLGQDTQIDDYLIKIIYYNYYNQDENNKMTLNEFISFIKSDIYPNDNFKKSIDSKTKNNLDLLENFTSLNLINKPRSTAEIANILGMNETDAQNILIYYNSKNINTTMTIKDFVNFLLNDVANDPNYAASLDKATISSLKRLQSFTDPSNINKKMKTSEIANIFGIEENKVKDLFLFYRTTGESQTKLTLNEFANFALEMAQQENYKNMFAEDTLKSLTLLKTLSDEKNINTPLDLKMMQSSLNNLGLNLDENSLSLLYLYYTGTKTDTKLTLNEFASTALAMSQNGYAKDFNDQTLKELTVLKNLTANSPLTKEELYQTFAINKKTIGKETFAQLDGAMTADSMTPSDFINILKALLSEFSKGVDSSQLETLTQSLAKAQALIDNKETYTVKEVASVISQDENLVKVIYGVYDSHKDNLAKISVKELINFLNENQNNQLLASYLEGKSDLLNTAYAIVNNTDLTYSYQEISALTNTNEEQVKQIYGVYDYYHEETYITPQEFANLLINNKDNALLKNQLSKATLKELNLVVEVMNSTSNYQLYTASNLSSLLGIDNDTISLLFSLYDYKYSKANNDISLYNDVDFMVNDVMNNPKYAPSFNDEQKNKLVTINNLMHNSLNQVKYTSNEAFGILDVLSDDLDKTLLDLVYMYYGSTNEYNPTWRMTVEEFVNYLNSNIITDKRFNDFINKEKKETIIAAKKTIDKSKKLIVSDKYSRAVLNTKYAAENKETYAFINNMQKKIGNKDDIYIVGDSPMAVEISKTFNRELNKITLLTMIFIFIVVAITFKDLIIPVVLVLIIQTAVYITMSAISLTGGSVYFISLLIVQAILMGATIDYAIVYTSYYREARLTMGIKDSVINAYNKSILTIISSSSILIIVTLIVAGFASAIAAKICETISEGTFASVILILFLLPGVLAATDKFICRKGYYKEKNKKS